MITTETPTSVAGPADLRQTLPPVRGTGLLYPLDAPGICDPGARSLRKCSDPDQVEAILRRDGEENISIRKLSDITLDSSGFVQGGLRYGGSALKTVCDRLSPGLFRVVGGLAGIVRCWQSCAVDVPAAVFVFNEAARSRFNRIEGWCMSVDRSTETVIGLTGPDPPPSHRDIWAACLEAAEQCGFLFHDCTVSGMNMRLRFRHPALLAPIRNSRLSREEPCALGMLVRGSEAGGRENSLRVLPSLFVGTPEAVFLPRRGSPVVGELRVAIAGLFSRGRKMPAGILTPFEQALALPLAAYRYGSRSGLAAWKCRLERKTSLSSSERVRTVMLASQARGPDAGHPSDMSLFDLCRGLCFFAEGGDLPTQEALQKTAYVLLSKIEDAPLRRGSVS